MGWSEWKNLGGDINCIANNYDPNEEYDTENNPYCLIDDLLYKVLEDGVTGPLDMTKWKRAYLTDNIHTNSNLGFSLKAVNANRGGTSANVISCLAIDDQKYKKIKITNITGGTPTYIRGFSSKSDMINGSNYVTLGIGEYEINFKYILISYSSVPANTAYENEITIT